MAENRKRILDAFESHLFQNYTNYCQRQGEQPTTDGMITFLIDNNLIPAVAIKRFTILQEFDKLYPLKENHKTKTVYALSDKFNISERTIWNILKGKYMNRG